MRVRRAEQRQVQHSRHLDVVDIAALPGEQPEILASAERPSHIGAGLRQLIHLGQPPGRRLVTRKRSWRGEHALLDDDDHTTCRTWWTVKPSCEPSAGLPALLSF